VSINVYEKFYCMQGYKKFIKMIDEKRLLKDLISGKLKLYELENYVNSFKACEIRRRFVEKVTKTKLRHVGHFSIDAEGAMKKNIENMIGVVQIPLGIAGPLKIDGKYAKGDFYIPLATTEGALVASVNRGCSAITKSGGVRTFIIKDAMTRAPVFRFESAKIAIEFVGWIEKHFSDIKEVAESTTKHGVLLNIEPWVVGRNVFLRFSYDTKDASGLNMVTIATDAAVRYIEENFKGAVCVSLSGNLCVDKKPAALNFILGRGKSVIAEAIIKREVCKEILKTTPEDIVEVNYRKNLIGSALSLSYGFNAHYANIIAALFIATGQDEAHAVDGSLGITTTELYGDDLYVSVYLPCIYVGTVGGGTRVETQRECLEILGVAGSGDPPGVNAKKLSEIVAAAVLAGELSLLAALAAGHLAKAHKKFGRGKSV